jgi:protein-disulfide isomerase
MFGMTLGGTRMRGLIATAMVLALAACDNSASTAATGTKTAAKPTTITTATTAAPSTATKDWTTVMVATPEGGFRMGNPDAKVKLLEFASLTCPHCKAFHDEAHAKLKATYIAGGKVSYEYRSFVLNGPDFAAALLARCQGPVVFFNLLNAFYANQAAWTEPFTKLTESDSARLKALPADQQIAALADTGGLDDFMRTRGMTKAKFDQCLSDKAAVEQLTKIRNDAVEKYKLTGTPTFVINGETQKDVYSWETLEPKLIAALK